MLGIPALGVVDRNSLAGIVRAHDAAKTTGVRLVIGCRLDLEDGTAMLVYPTDRAAYSRLCRLLSNRQGASRQGCLPARLGRCGRVGRRASRGSRAGADRRWACRSLAAPEERFRLPRLSRSDPALPAERRSSAL